jgi:hypothetical protein
MGLFLDHPCQCRGLCNVAGLGCFRSTAPYQDQDIVTAGKIHAPTGPEELTHLVDARSNGLHVTELPDAGLA